MVRNKSSKAREHLSRKISVMVVGPLVVISSALIGISALEMKQSSDAFLAMEHQRMLEIRQHGVKQVVETAQGAIKHLVSGKEITPAVQAQAAEIIRNLRFDNGNYIFAVDFDGITRVQPVNPAHEGKDNTAVRDAAGRPFIRDMVELAKRGGGLYQYEWKNPESGAVEVKYSYAGAAKELGWMIGAGVYATDIDAQMEKLKAQHDDELAQTILTSVLISLALILVGGVLALAAARRISRRVESTALDIQSLTEQLNQGTGDLTRRIQVLGNDEISGMAIALNGYLQHTQLMISQIKAAAGAVHRISLDISEHSDELASRSEESSASLQQTSASMEEITATVQNSAGAAAEVSRLASQAAGAASDGESAMRSAEETMRQIMDASNQIASITTLIDSIAFQTNLLALNASVEAARAGEHGRGFAVVAQEVRSLAEKTRLSAQDIRRLIETAGQHIRNGESVVSSAVATMKDISGHFAAVNVAVEEISLSAQEQSAGILQVNSAVSQMDSMTQQNARMVQELAALSHDLSRQAEAVSSLLSGFHVGTAEVAQ